jgi:RNA polymerase sigma-70 factor (ECF subfamily)
METCTKNAILEEVFRNSRRRLIAALVRRFGVDQFMSAENAVQEASVRALERWNGGSAKDLEGWLLRVANNLLVDVYRRERRMVPLSEMDEAMDVLRLPELDDELRLIFLCCHPVLPHASQITLTLRVAFGFSSAQIGRAFVSDERTVAQRITRAKQRLREEAAQFEIPNHDEVPSRLAPILDVLYQVFTEGYASTAAEGGIDREVCDESLRLVRLITDDNRLATPESEALRALLCFHAGRSLARQADDGSLLLLHEQDRTRWNGELLGEGFVFLARAARGTDLSRFHLEAGIAACHAKSPTFSITDWPEILRLYDILRSISPSPVVEVNRALAVAMCSGANAGLEELDAIPERELISRYPYALAGYAELYTSLGQIQEGRSFLLRALQEQTSPAERALLQRKLNNLAQDGSASIHP